MGFFDELKEAFVDTTRRRTSMYAGLRKLGMDAKKTKYHRPEQDIAGGWETGYGYPLGLIDILEGSIHWVNVRKERVSTGQGGWVTSYYTNYGVPDSRLGPNSPKIWLMAVRKKAFPLFGKVVDLRWKGRDFGSGILSRLSDDISLKYPIMRGHDLIIESQGSAGCWIISTRTGDVPSIELWNCYQAIAQHLLAEWPQDATAKL